MAGHSKWANIKHQKNIKDKKKSKLFSKLINTINTSLKTTSSNDNKLKNAIDQALNHNISKNTIKCLIKKNEKIEKKFTFLNFKSSDNIFITLEILDDKVTISEVKYTLNNFLFTHIKFNFIENLISKFEKITILDKYNEAIINKLLINIKINNAIDSTVITNDNKSKDIIEVLIKNNKKIKYSIFIEYKNKISVSQIKKKRINDLNQKLKKNINIKNVYTNII